VQGADHDFRRWPAGGSREDADSGFANIPQSLTWVPSTLPVMLLMRAVCRTSSMFQSPPDNNGLLALDLAAWPVDRRPRSDLA